MRNKRGWLRIVEAVIGIMIVMGFLLYFISERNIKTDISGDVNQRQLQILSIISKNDSLRNDILNDNSTQVNIEISKMIPASWNFSTNICLLQDICNRAYTPNDRDVFTEEILITSNLTEYQPKKLRFFVWMK